MKYITGLAALNLPSLHAATGDWHGYDNHASTQLVLDTDDSPFGEWGVERRPVNGRMSYVATHPRAALDLIEQGLYSDAQGMREYYINDESLTEEIFALVMKLRDRDDWSAISRLMGREYLCTWLDWLEKNDVRQ